MAARGAGGGRSAARIKLGANFEHNLADVEAYLAQAEAPSAYAALLDELLDTVIPNLERYPAMGRLFLDRPAGSVEGDKALQKLRARLGEGELREYILREYLVLYLREGALVYLLCIRHHRQLSFDFDQLWGRP